MTDLIVSDSLKNRRQTLRSQRRLKGWQSIWRFSVLCGVTGGLVWLMSRPEWAIRDQSQIQLSGNQLLSASQLYQLVPITYPQSIWQLSTQQLGKKMETIPPLARVEVTRQLFPAQISIAVQERQPIAIATSDQGKGYLDKEGTFISQSFYKAVPSGAKLPTVPQFLGFSPQYKQFWQQNYPFINASSVKITTIDGRNPSNIILGTEIGSVYLGSDVNQLPQQLKVLGKMKNLPSRVPVNRIAYIDLTNSAYPSIRLKSLAKTPVSSKIKNP